MFHTCDYIVCTCLTLVSEATMVGFSHMQVPLLVFLAIRKTDYFEAKLVQFESFSNTATFCHNSHSASPLDLADEHPQTDIFSAYWDVYMPDVGTTFHTLVEGLISVQMLSKLPQLPLFDTSHLFGIEVCALCDAARSV